MDATTIRETLAGAVALQQAGRLDEAYSRYQQVLAAEADNVDALHLSGLILLARGELDASLERLAAATRLSPAFKVAHNSLGNALKAAGRLDQARAAYRRALALDSGYLSAWINLGSTENALGDFAAAGECLARVLAVEPDNVAALVNLGNALRGQQRFDAAIAAYHRAHVASPGDPEILVALGNCCHRCGRDADARGCFEQALVVAPDCAAAHNAIGAWLQQQGQVEAALRAYRQALALAPDDADSGFNEATALLLLGDYAAGWRRYECRWQLAAATRRNFPQPLWRGDSDLRGRTILLHAEQGFGDTLQFVRFVPQVAALGARVVLEVQPALKALLDAAPDRVTVVARGEPLPPFDLHCPLLSLPLAFGLRVDAIPAPIPYLRTDPQRSAEWRRRLEQLPRPHIGLAWSSARRGEDPYERSLPLGQLLAALDGLPGSLVGLQTEYLDRDREALANPGRLCTLAGEIRDFADTAAIVGDLDLVITIDTVVAHLAGALAAPTWTLLPFAADWRWLVGRSDSPWYPGMRLFRQAQPGDWAAVLAAVADELAAFVAAGRG